MGLLEVLTTSKHGCTIPTLVDMGNPSEDAAGDDDVRVLIVTAAGRAFCAGGNPRDIDRSRSQEASPNSATTDVVDRGVHEMALAVARLEKPYIAAINGAAVGGGMDFASMCDIRIASDKAKFAMDELLNREVFTTLIEARILIERWRQEYNQVRPHNALGYRPPTPETRMPVSLTL